MQITAVKFLVSILLTVFSYISNEIFISLWSLESDQIKSTYCLFDCLFIALVTGVIVTIYLSTYQIHY